jgi:(R)-2-hydroxyacyl-CoA dehydratese activating ATPase
MDLFAGVDVGSTTGKALLLDDSGKIQAYHIMTCLPRPEETARRCLRAALEKGGIEEKDILFTVATGYGRVKIPFANENISEITCHAMGAKWLCPTIRTVLDIGGQDCKAIGVRDDGKVREFVMNDKCAAGTGRFLESQARVLGIGIEDLSVLSNKANAPAVISAQCSVFAESEVITQLNDGNSLENIVTGIHLSIITRLMSLLKRVGIKEDLTVAGGCAKNEGLISMLQKVSGIKIVRLKEDPQITGALGAALLARERYQKQRMSDSLCISPLSQNSIR